jgi:hypothetical protein
MKDKTRLLMILVMLQVVGCGRSDDDPNAPNPTSSNFNGNVTGRIFLGNDDVGPWILDLKTGHYGRIPGVQWEDNPKYHHSAEFSAYPAHGGREFLETVEECKHLGGFDYRDCLVIHDSSGKILSTLHVPNQTYGPAKLSRDGKFIAVPIRDPSSALNPRKLTIFTRDGAYVDASPPNHNVTPKGFDWLPGNRLIYAAGNELFVTGQVSAQGKLWARFTKDEGQPDHLAVSPDGKRLALTLKTAVNYVAIHGTVLVVNLDASGYVRLATTPDTDDPNTTSDDPVINLPMWSPDGKWIAVIEGAIGVISPPSGSKGYGSKLYIVPSNGENIVLTLDGQTEAIPVYSYYDEVATPGSKAKLGTKFTTFVSGGGFAWIE